MDIKTYAAILLAGQSVAVVFTALILKRQAGLFKTNIQADLVWFRRVMFAMTLGIFLGELVFLAINLLTLLDVVTRSTHRINPVGLVYGLDITFVVMLFSILTWLLYRMAAKVLIRSDNKEVQ
jgi:hypothetical protein